MTAGLTPIEVARRCAAECYPEGSICHRAILRGDWNRGQAVLRHLPVAADEIMVAKVPAPAAGRVAA